MFPTTAAAARSMPSLLTMLDTTAHNNGDGDLSVIADAHSTNAIRFLGKSATHMYVSTIKPDVLDEYVLPPSQTR
jgi:hypothetical protein